ncbi:AAA domain-containing protein [Methanocella arvoryzae]|uniref:PLD phosphodiesterase domain-containing protein n=1 Tax=Methanocella arvoryzae (strain DSM 22066 / NBRC 105507 / MRE50) TaxID=351160 RepID=Q0W201_METAR|nr:AAA domain-containing protein [Methanocella arvoryzae]CAJ37592.1 conserved hypothetical protein [Methanocella arvoryzae MRE50]
MEKSTGWRATAGSSNPVELIQAFRQAITEEIVYIKTKGRDIQLDLKNGEFITKSLEYFIYRFPLDVPVKVSDDTPVDIYVGKKKTEGLIVTSGDDYIDIAITEDYGLTIHNITVRSDTSALLDLLLKRYDDLLSNGNFDTIGPMKLFGFIEPEPINACDLTVSDSFHLNECQKQVITHALSQEVTFVWGPPGTGKTKTLSVLLNHLIRAKKTVLLISHTNLALDEVIKKFAEDPENRSLIDDGKVIRYGNPSNNDPVIKNFLLDNVNDRIIGVAYQKIDELKRQLRDCEQKITQILIITESPDYRKLKYCEEELAEDENKIAALSEKIRTVKLQIVACYREKNQLETEAEERLKKKSGKGLFRLLGTSPSPKPDAAIDEKILQIQQLKASEKALSDELHYAEINAGELKSDIQKMRERICYTHSLAEDRLIDILPVQLSDLREEFSAIESDIFEIKKEIVKYENFIFGNAMVVGCTLTKCYVDRNLQHCKFDVMILDEASMANLPAIFYAAGRASQYVIAGDFRQIAPIAQSSGPNASLWLKRDIFSQAGIVESIKAGRVDSRLVMLKEQYRMHPKIAGIINDKMYAGQLITNDQTKTDRDQIAALPPYAGHAVVLCDTSKINPWCSYSGSSKINLYSAMLAAKLAESAIAGGIKSAGIITPYKKQVKLIEKQLMEQNIDRKTVSVTTIHKSQGNEKDCIIIDLVEGLPHNLGKQFRSSSIDSDTARLINVAISRAKGKLIVISNNQYFSERLKPGTIFHDLLQEICNKGLVVDSENLLLSNPAISGQTTLSGKAEISPDSKQLIYNATEFYRAFIVDIDHASSRIVIFSPFITRKRMDMLMNPLKAAVARGVKVHLIIRNLKEDKTRADKEKLIEELTLQGINAIIASDTNGVRSSFHEKIALIDKTVFYFGSLNILSQTGNAGTSDYMFAFASPRTIEDLIRYFRIDIILGRQTQPKGRQTTFLKKSFDEEMADAQFGAAIIHLRQQKYKEAVKELKAAIKLCSFKPDYHYYLSKTLLTIDDVTGARKAIDKAIELSPDNVEYREFKTTSGLS